MQSLRKATVTVFWNNSKGEKNLSREEVILMFAAGYFFSYIVGNPVMFLMALIVSLSDECT